MLVCLVSLREFLLLGMEGEYPSVMMHGFHFFLFGDFSKKKKKSFGLCCLGRRNSFLGMSVRRNLRKEENR